MAGKADMIDYLAGNLEGMTKKGAGEAIDVLFDYVSDALARGDRVQIPGFGTFAVSHRAARAGRNPQTNQPMTIPASNTVRFKPGKGLRDAVN